MIHRPLPRRCALWLSASVLAGASQAATVELSLQAGDGKPLADAVVFLESKEARAAAKPSAGVEIEQAAKRFTHRVSVVTLGSEVAFPNRDKVRHHVYSFSPTKTFELKLYAGTPANPVLFDKAGIAVLGCNIHDNMAAWVVVADTPWFARSADDGRARIEGVPAGSYRLRVWHPGLGANVEPLTSSLAIGAADVAQAVKLPVSPQP